jgi:hypothetical protein
VPVPPFPPFPELPLVLVGFAVEVADPAPAVVLEAPPVAVEVALPLAAPDDAFAVLLFAPAPPFPPVSPIMISFMAALVCVRLFMFAAMLPPLFVADALLVPLVAPSVGLAVGLLLFVFVVVLLPTVLLVPETSAAARLHSASARTTSAVETVVLRFKIPPSVLSMSLIRTK